MDAMLFSANWYMVFGLNAICKIILLSLGDLTIQCQAAPSRARLHRLVSSS